MTYYVGSVQATPSDVRHFGIPGMKWGQRRFQNPDGTLTPEGRERYARSGTGRGVQAALVADAARVKVKKAVTPAVSQSGKQVADYGKQTFENAANAARTASRRTPSKAERESVGQMSDSELRSRINRMQMEQQYLQLSGATQRRGAAEAEKILSVTGSIVGIASGAIGIAVTLNQLKKG